MKVLALISTLGAAQAFAPQSASSSSASSSSTELAMGLKTQALKNTISSLGGPGVAAVAGAAVAGTIGMKTVLDRPSRKYEDGSVAREYDAWTQDGILEYYWGEHIHLGYYDKEE